MIVNIRGTSGSGKSTLARKLMELYPEREAVHTKGRKQPLGYYLSGFGDKRLAVVGHYETPCGGTDTIPSMDEIYRLVKTCHEQGCHVLYEGLLLSAEVNRCVALNEDTAGELLVVALDTDLEVCVDSINQRRWAKNPDKPPVARKNTESKYKGTKRSVERLQEAGVNCEWHSRESAFERLKTMLGEIHA